MLVTEKKLKFVAQCYQSHAKRLSFSRLFVRYELPPLTKNGAELLPPPPL
jgi:hypothetical protein